MSEDEDIKITDDIRCMVYDELMKRANETGAYHAREFLRGRYMELANKKAGINNDGRETVGSTARSD